MARKDIPDKIVVLAVHYAWQNKLVPRAHVVLHQWTGQPEKVCYRAMERALNHGLIDFGVNLTCAFLTDEGKALL